MGNLLIRNNFMGKIIKAKRGGGGGIESKVIEEYTPLMRKTTVLKPRLVKVFYRTYNLP